MYSTIHEPLDRLRGFVRSVRREFTSTGFRIKWGAQANKEEFVESQPLGCWLLSRRIGNYENFVAEI